MPTRVGRIVLWEEHEVAESRPRLWMPLILFLARAREEGVHPAFLFELDFRDFMLLHGVERKPRPFLYVFKHIESRREVVVDQEGSPYRFLPRAESGQYRTSSFNRAVWQLDPLLIRDERRRRRGDTVEDEFEDSALDDLDPIDHPVNRRPHLRLVR